MPKRLGQRWSQGFLVAVYASLSLSVSCAARAEPVDGVQETYREHSYSMQLSALNRIYGALGEGGFSFAISDTVAEVTWTDDCLVTLNAVTILPEWYPGLLEGADLSPEDITNFNELRRALVLFEAEKLQIWRYYAREVKKQNCEGDLQVVNDFWQSQLADLSSRLRQGAALLNPHEMVANSNRR